MLRSLSSTQLRTICKNPESWFRRQLRPSSKRHTLNKTIGTVVHLRLSGKDADSAEVQRAFQDYDRVRPGDLTARVVAFLSIDSARHFHTPSSAVKNAEVAWQDPVTGWLLFAQPNTYWFDQGTMHIAVYKTSPAVHRDSLRQLQFYALVLSKAFNHTGPIVVHCRLLGSELVEHEYDVDVGRFDILLDLARRAINHIEMQVSNAIECIIDIVPNSAKLVDKAVKEKDLGTALTNWFTLSYHCHLPWNQLHARELRSWAEVRLLPMRIAQRLCQRRSGRDWVPAGPSLNYGVATGEAVNLLSEGRASVVPRV